MSECIGFLFVRNMQLKLLIMKHCELNKLRSNNGFIYDYFTSDGFSFHFLIFACRFSGYLTFIYENFFLGFLVVLWGVTVELIFGKF